MSDPFNLKNEASKQAAAIREWAETGEGEQELDQDWHVPFLLGEETRLLSYQFQERGKAADFRPRNADERSTLELERFKLFRLSHEHLTEKYSAASRTLDLLREIQTGKRGFVLLLWGFGTQTRYLEGATFSNIDIGAQLERDKIAEKLSPTPLLWIADPIESGAHELSSETKLRELGLGFRIESGRNWEENVGLLISAASFIIVQNAEMTPGITREIERVREKGRLSDTFFASPEKAQQFCDGHDLHPLTEENIERMRSEATARLVPDQSLPEPTCLWVEGAKRQRLSEEFVYLFRHVEAARWYQTPIHFDWLLDAYYSLIASAILLERLDLLQMVLKWMCEMAAAIPVEEFPHGETLSKAYEPFQRDYHSALEKIPQGQPLTAQLEQTYRYLRTHSGK